MLAERELEREDEDEVVAAPRGENAFREQYRIIEHRCPECDRAWTEGRGGRYAIAYAESDDGVSWKRPELGLHEWKGSKRNNIVWKGIDGKRGSQVYLLEVPVEDRRGYRYLMLYGGGGSPRGR